MSTKIYTAYRTKYHNTWRFNWDLISQIKYNGQKSVKQTLKALYNKIADAVDPNSEPYKEQRGYLENNPYTEEQKDRLAKLYVVDKTIVSEYAKTTSSYDRQAFNLDVNIGVHEYKGYLYLIPYCDWLMGESLDFLDKMPQLRDYKYFNNTDRPEEISEQDWTERGKVWDRIHDRWSDQVIIDICTWRGYYMLSPLLDLSREVMIK